jgi:hypothetical protein
MASSARPHQTSANVNPRTRSESWAPEYRTCQGLNASPLLARQLLHLIAARITSTAWPLRVQAIVNGTESLGDDALALEDADIDAMCAELEKRIFAARIPDVRVDAIKARIIESVGHFEAEDVRVVFRDVYAFAGIDPPPNPASADPVEELIEAHRRAVEGRKPWGAPCG